WLRSLRTRWPSIMTIPSKAVLHAMEHLGATRCRRVLTGRVSGLARRRAPNRRSRRERRHRRQRRLKKLPLQWKPRWFRYGVSKQSGHSIIWNLLSMDGLLDAVRKLTSTRSADRQNT